MKTSVKDIHALSEVEMKLMNVWMKKEFGEKYVRNFKEYYPSGSKCFFIKENKKLVAFGILGSLVVEHNGEKYDIFGIGDIITINRGEGYGKILIATMINYLKDTGKSGLGFCSRNNTLFYQKSGLSTHEGFMKKFSYRNPDNGEVVCGGDGDGIFYDGDNNLIEKFLTTSSPIYLNSKLW